MSRAAAVRELVGTTFHFHDDVARNLHTLGELARSATVAKLEIGSLDDAVLAVEQLVSENLLGAL